MARNRLGMESGWASMTGKGNSFQAASSLCHTLSTALAGDGWRASLSANHNCLLSMDDRCRDRAGQGSNRIFFVSRKFRTWRATGSAANMPISWLMICDVVIRLCRADFTIYLSSQTLVMAGRWESVCHPVWSSATHWFRILMTVDECRPVRRETGLNF